MRLKNRWKKAEEESLSALLKIAKKKLGSMFMGAIGLCNIGRRKLMEFFMGAIVLHQIDRKMFVKLFTVIIGQIDRIKLVGVSMCIIGLAVTAVASCIGSYKKCC